MVKSLKTLSWLYHGRTASKAQTTLAAVCTTGHRTPSQESIHCDVHAASMYFLCFCDAFVLAVMTYFHGCLCFRGTARAQKHPHCCSRPLLRVQQSLVKPLALETPWGKSMSSRELGTRRRKSVCGKLLGKYHNPGIYRDEVSLGETDHVVSEFELEAAAAQGLGASHLRVDVRGILAWQARVRVPPNTQRLVSICDIINGVAVLHLPHT